MKLSDYVEQSFAPQHIMVFGDSKTGKTELVGKLAERFKLHWFDLENGFKTLLKLPAAFKENITLYHIPDTRSYPVGIDTMLKVIKGGEVKICEQHGKVTCLVCQKNTAPQQTFTLHKLGPNDIFIVDSGTQLGNSAMNHLTRNLDDDYKPDWDDYRRQGFMLDRFLSNLQHGAYHAIIISHTTMARMENAEKTKLVPVMGTDNFSRNVAKYFDHVVYCDIGTGKHVYGSSTIYRPQILTGSRTDVRIEDQEKENAKAVVTLMPFFDGTIPPAEKESKPDATVSALEAARARAASIAAVNKTGDAL